jgi:hypothetical protein
VFFSHNKSASAKISLSETIQRTGRISLRAIWILRIEFILIIII